MFRRLLSHVIVLVMAVLAMAYFEFSLSGDTGAYAAGLPVAADNTFTISGYIKPDFSYKPGVEGAIRAGFNVEITGTGLSAKTDGNGYYEIKNIPINSNGYTVKISKQCYLYRQISNVPALMDITIGTQTLPVEMWAGDMPIKGVQDNAINMIDVVEFSRSFNSISTDARYNPNGDLNMDNAINMMDIVAATRHFNKASSDYPVFEIVKQTPFVFDKGTGTITGYTGEGGDVTIPDMIQGVGVTRIGNYVFSNCSGLTGITIPEKVTSIGIGAFSYCRNLTSVSIPEGLTSIEGYAFLYCSKLNDITIPERVTGIGEYAFSGCSGLTRIIIPEGVKGIMNGTFLECSGLTDVSMPKGATSLGDQAFTGCDSLKGITIPESVTSIGYGTFSYCGGLTGITIPKSVKSIGKCAFLYCQGLSGITIPEGVTSIGDYAFQYCSGLKNALFLGKKPLSMGIDVFKDTDKDFKVTFSDAILPVKGLIENPDGKQPVGGIVNVNGWVLDPGGVGRIEVLVDDISVGEAVYGIQRPDIYEKFIDYKISDAGFKYDLDTGNLSLGEHTIKVRETSRYQMVTELDIRIITVETVLADEKDFEFNTARKTITKYKGKSMDVRIPGTIKGVGVTSIGDGAFENCSELIGVTIPNSVTGIGNKAFRNCSKLTSVTMPKGLTSIGAEAFYGCGGLKGITIPGSVTRIGNAAFHGCSGLADITIPTGVTGIGEDLFNGCSGLTGITIPESVTSIGNRAFQNCSGLSGITIPKGVTGIGEGAFYGCSGLTGITIPEKVISIKSAVFYGCSGLTGLKIPKAVTAIGEDAFAECGGLTDITIPESVTGIGSRAFQDCVKLSSITIPEGVKSIGGLAFYGCTGLTDITLPKSVTNLEDAVFYGCSGLSAITIPEGVTGIGVSTFHSCSGLKSITIPKSVTSIGDYAFYGCSGLSNAVFMGNQPSYFGSSAFYGVNEDFRILVSSTTAGFGIPDPYNNETSWNWTIDDSTYKVDLVSYHSGAAAG